MKKGITTSELWTSVLSTILMIVSWMGWLTPANATDMTQAAVPVVMSIANAIHVFTYILGRNMLKEKDLELKITQAKNGHK